MQGTPAGWAVLLGSFATLIAGRLMGLPELFVLGAIGVLALVMAVLAARRLPAGVVIERRVTPDQVPIGEDATATVTVANRGRRSSPVFDLQDRIQDTVVAALSVPPVAPGRRHAVRFKLPTERRGLIEVGPLVATRTDPLGLVRRREPRAGEVPLLVLPAIELLGAGPTGGLDDPLVGITHPASGVSGEEDFAGLRPYVVGDDLRRVHWPSTARTDELMIRQDDPPWQGYLTVLLDARRGHLDPDDFERAVSATASLLDAAMRTGDRARLAITNGLDSAAVDARDGRSLLMTHLAEVDQHMPGPLPRIEPEGRRQHGALVVVTGDLGEDDLQQVARMAGRFATTRVVAIGSLAAPVASGAVRTVPVPIGTSFAAAWAASRSVVTR